MLINKAYIIQLESLFRQKKAMPGAKELVQALNREQVIYRIITEQSSLAARDIFQMLRNVGIEIAEETCIYSSTMAAVDYIAAHDKNAKTADYIGGPGIRETLLDAGFKITQRNPQYIFVGMDRSLSYDEYQDAFCMIQKGAKLVSVDHRRTQEIDQIEKIGNGAIIKMLEYAAGTKAMNFGCGSKILLKLASRPLPYSRQETIMIGNRFKRDILPALELGMLTFYVAGSEEMMKQGISDDIHPDYILDDLRGLLR